MKNTEAKLIYGLIKKENRVKAVEAQGFIMMLYAEKKCSESLFKDVESYIEILTILYQKFQKLGVYYIQRKENPIEKEDFAKFINFHVEVNTLLDAAKEKMRD